MTDIYRNVIETPESIPEEIRKKIDFYKGDTMGRIYRIVPNKPLRTGNLKPGLGQAEFSGLGKASRESKWLAQVYRPPPAARAPGQVRHSRSRKAGRRGRVTRGPGTRTMAPSGARLQK